MKDYSFLFRTVLFSFVLIQISCNLQRAGRSANLMDDGIYYDPDVEWIDLYAEEESDIVDQEEEGFDVTTTHKMPMTFLGWVHRVPYGTALVRLG